LDIIGVKRIKYLMIYIISFYFTLNRVIYFKEFFNILLREFIITHSMDIRQLHSAKTHLW